MFCLLKEEMQRRDRDAYEDFRRKGASLIASMVRDWWSGVSNSINNLCLLAVQRQWRNAFYQNQSFVTQLTDRGPNWMAYAISRSSSAQEVCSNVADDQDWRQSAVFQTSGSSTMSSSFESLVDLDSSASSHYSREGSSMSRRHPRASSSTLMPPPHTPDNDNLSSDSSISVSSSLATDKEDVTGLVADGELSLGELLEPYMSNGWSPRTHAWSTEPQDSDEDYSDEGTISHQVIVNALRHDASLPIRQLLQPGYLPISGSTVSMNGGDSPPRRRQSSRRSTRPILNGVSPGLLPMEEDEDSEEASEDSDSETCSIMSLPREAVQHHTKQVEPWISLSPGEIARRGRNIVHLKQQLLGKNSKRVLRTLLPAFGPTCRVPFLPTSTLCKSLIIT